MDFGLFIFPSDTTLQPIELARSAEQAGFESIWFPEHSHIPVSRESPWGGVKDAAPLPEFYWRTHDPLIALAAAAAVTTRLKLATGITLVAQRDPLWLAKEVASLDVISEGRFILGVGYGWNREEMASHGVDFSSRRELVREKVLMMKQLWTEDVASFSGKHLHLEPSWAWPKPLQHPHPPVVVGGALGPKAIANLVEWADGWVPNAVRHNIEENITRLRGAVAEAGRDPDGFTITTTGSPQTSEGIERLIGLGVNRALFNLPQGSPAEVQERIEELAELVRPYRA